MPFLIANWRLVLEVVVIGILAVALTFQTTAKRHYKAKAEAVQAEFDGFKLKVAALGEAAKADAKRKEATQKELTDNAAKNYESRLAAIRKYYAGLRAGNPGSGGVRPVPDAAAVVDAAAADPVFAGLCAETTEQVIQLQDWIRGQAAVR